MEQADRGVGGRDWARTAATFAAVAMAAVVAVAACGGEGGGGAAATKQEWQSEHGALVAAFERDLEATRTAIDQGEKQATISACLQLSDDAQEMRSEVFPVPNPAVDRPLRRSVDLALEAAENCVRGGRNPEGAHEVEVAMDELEEAQRAFEEARAAVAEWT